VDLLACLASGGKIFSGEHVTECKYENRMAVSVAKKKIAIKHVPFLHFRLETALGAGHSQIDSATGDSSPHSNTTQLKALWTIPPADMFSPAVVVAVYYGTVKANLKASSEKLVGVRAGYHADNNKCQWKSV
jgi:hypothetical protein